MRLFDEFGAALQFPSYFGGNWHAFDECMSDLNWTRGLGYAILITECEEVLADEPESITLLMEILADVAAGWSRPTTYVTYHPHQEVPFHVVLQVTSALDLPASFGTGLPEFTL